MPVLFALLLVLLFMWLAASAARRARRAAYQAQLEQEARRRHEAASRGQSHGGDADDEDAAPAFGSSPFGGLLESLMTAAGARSYAYDPDTGRWIDVSGQQPPTPTTQPNGHGATTEHPPAPPRRRSRRTPAQNPLGSLLGGGMTGGDGSGEFEVQPPDELTTFADVGGMDALKQEVRETVGLMLQHPEQAERYGIDWN